MEETSQLYDKNIRNLSRVNSFSQRFDIKNPNSFKTIKISMFIFQFILKFNFYVNINGGYCNELKTISYNISILIVLHHI